MLQQAGVLALVLLVSASARYDESWASLDEKFLVLLHRGFWMKSSTSLSIGASFRCVLLSGSRQRCHRCIASGPLVCSNRGSRGMVPPVPDDSQPGGSGVSRKELRR